MMIRSAPVVIVALSTITNLSSEVLAQRLDPSNFRCAMSLGINSTQANARYQWALRCHNNPPPPPPGFTFSPEQWLTSSSISAYNASSDNPLLFPIYYNFLTTGNWDPPDDALADCLLRPTSAINIGICTIGAGCADGTQEQIFLAGLVGCAGATTYTDRSALCASGYRLATAAEWVAFRKGIAPVHNYWTNDALKFSGAGTSSCFVSTSVGTDCGTTPMRVCTASGIDPEGNQCNWQHCGIEANAPDQFFGGCAGNTNAGALCILGGCADGTVEQTFAGGMVGCAGSTTFANRAALCRPGFRPATATEWVTLRQGLAPTHDYWTNDALKWSGSGPSACSVSTTVGSDSCGTSPMRVCTPNGFDAEGNTCNWTHCGLDTNTPDQFFGGCVSNAGTLCVPDTGCADGSVEQVFDNGMVGCAGSVTFAGRATLCGPGYAPVTAAQWVANRGTAVPTHDYWTNDALKWNGSGPSACFVSTTVGSDSCGTSPMRVCTPNGLDAEGNTCNWTHCGLDANTPDQFFGGCVSNAGTLCAPSL
jgi:hypothetical protein